jgi:hypothetical protein
MWTWFDVVCYGILLLAHILYFKKLQGLRNHLCVCVSTCLNVWKLEEWSQKRFLCVSACVSSLSLLGDGCKYVPTTTNTRNSRKIVGRVLFYVFHVVSTEIRQSVLSRTLLYMNDVYYCQWQEVDPWKLSQYGGWLGAGKFRSLSDRSRDCSFCYPCFRISSGSHEVSHILIKTHSLNCFAFNDADSSSLFGVG